MKKITCRRNDGSTYETVCYSKNGPLVIAKMVNVTDPGRYAVIHIPSGCSICYRDSIAALRPLLPELHAICDWDRPFWLIADSTPDLAAKVGAVTKSYSKPYVSERALSW